MIQQTAKRIKLLNIIAAELAFPAVLGFAWLFAEGRHTGPLGFFLAWLVGVGVALRVYAQFLRLWYGVGYPNAATKAQTTEVASSLAVLPLTAQDIALLAPPTTRNANVATVLALSVSNERRPERGDVEGTRQDEKPWFEEVQKAWAKAEAPRVHVA
jgi:hypothetical protein